MGSCKTQLFIVRSVYFARVEGRSLAKRAGERAGFPATRKVQRGKGEGSVFEGKRNDAAVAVVVREVEGAVKR
jgi:hypothetical protein